MPTLAAGQQQSALCYFSVPLSRTGRQQRWLVEGLWSEQAVGIIGGEPKCGKSFLALDLAVAVSAGVPCLRRFAVRQTGRVLPYPAEDALHIVRRRLDGICAAAGAALAVSDHTAANWHCYRTKAP